MTWWVQSEFNVKPFWRTELPSTLLKSKRIFWTITSRRWSQLKKRSNRLKRKESRTILGEFKTKKFFISWLLFTSQQSIQLGTWSRWDFMQLQSIQNATTKFLRKSSESFPILQKSLMKSSKYIFNYLSANGVYFKVFGRMPENVGTGCGRAVETDKGRDDHRALQVATRFQCRHKHFGAGVQHKILHKPRQVRPWQMEWQEHANKRALLFYSILGWPKKLHRQIFGFDGVKGNVGTLFVQIWH